MVIAGLTASVGAHDVPASRSQVELVRVAVRQRFWMRDLVSAASEVTGASGGAGRPSVRLRRLIAASYRSVRYRPDPYVGWVDVASGVSQRAVARSTPDVILASGPPFSAYLVAAAISRACRVPWVADYRDPWTTGGYFPYGCARRWLDRRMEVRTLRDASAVLTVSEPIASDLESLLQRQVHVVLNGYVPASDAELGIRGGTPTQDGITLTFTGRLYGRKRDPTPLLKALSLMGEESRRVHVQLVGPDIGSVDGLAEDLKVAHCVETLGSVSHTEALRLQAQADVLLLLMWDDPNERGVYSAKLFEYVGSGRPILMLGLRDGVAADLIRSRKLGTVSNDPAEIARELRNWLALKDKLGKLPRVGDPSETTDLARGHQNAKAARILDGVVSGGLHSAACSPRERPTSDQH